MEPFRGMFTPIELGLGGQAQAPAVLDTSVLFAMVAYAMVAWLVGGLLDWVNGFLARLDVADDRAWRRGAEQRPAQASTPPGSPAPPASAP